MKGFDLNCPNANLSDCVDVVSLLSQFGRFDLVSMLLAAIGLILVGGGVFAFINFRSVAKEQATAEANRIAKEVAERVTNEYLQAELPNLIEAYRSYVETDSVSDDSAAKIANAQD